MNKKRMISQCLIAEKVWRYFRRAGQLNSKEHQEIIKDIREGYHVSEAFRKTWGYVPALFWGYA